VRGGVSLVDVGVDCSRPMHPWESLTSGLPGIVECCFEREPQTRLTPASLAVDMSSRLNGDHDGSVVRSGCVARRGSGSGAGALSGAETVGGGRSSPVSEFSTTASGLASLASCLNGAGLTDVAMEATEIH
jgi:hypothetical protein